MRKIAVITGATGGIGSVFSRQLAAQRYNLVLADMNLKKLQQLSDALCAEYPISVETIQVNLAKKDSIQNLAANLAGRARVDLLVNAAGYGEKTLFKDEKIQASLDMISVHVLATVQLIHAVLPGMMKRRKGSIIAVSSLASFIPAPGSSIYSATKSFINTFMESLHMEVRSKGIQVQSLCPGLTHTGFHTAEDIARYKGIRGLDLWMEADEVVAASLRNLSDDHIVCIPGFINKTIKKTIPVLPRRSYYRLAEKLSGR